MGQLVEFENGSPANPAGSSGGDQGEGEGGELPLRLEDFAPSLEQQEMSELMKVCSMVRKIGKIVCLVKLYLFFPDFNPFFGLTLWVAKF